MRAGRVVRGLVAAVLTVGGGLALLAGALYVLTPRSSESRVANPFEDLAVPIGLFLLVSGAVATVVGVVVWHHRGPRPPRPR